MEPREAVAAFGEDAVERLTRLFDDEVQMAATTKRVEAGLGKEFAQSAAISLGGSAKEGILWELLNRNYGEAAWKTFNLLSGGLMEAERRVIDNDMALALLGRTIPAVASISPPVLLSALARGTWGAGQQP